MVGKRGGRIEESSGTDENRIRSWVIRDQVPRWDGKKGS